MLTGRSRLAAKMVQPGPNPRVSKREQREVRRRAARRRKLRAWLLRGGLLAALGVALGLWQLDRRGPEEVVEAEVVGSRVWSHRGADGRMHTHQRVTVEIEGLVRATIDRGDDLELGQFVPVRIRRGGVTGRAYFVGLEAVQEQPEDGEPAQDEIPGAGLDALEGPG